jgi:threonine dehydrogenase-like Zn-dependent dehydrogenase
VAAFGTASSPFGSKPADRAAHLPTVIAAYSCPGFEKEFIGSWGCPVTSYPYLLSMVSTGKLNPRRLVDRLAPVEKASAVLVAMTDYATRGFNVINAW